VMEAAAIRSGLMDSEKSIEGLFAEAAAIMSLIDMEADEGGGGRREEEGRRKGEGRGHDILLRLSRSAIQ
jgi:hypothetical protein